MTTGLNGTEPEIGFTAIVVVLSGSYANLYRDTRSPTDVTESKSKFPEKGGVQGGRVLFGLVQLGVVLTRLTDTVLFG